MKAIETINLTKYYGKSRGIENLNLSVEQGECFGFIGPNGAGKSTTIRTLLGLISPTSGKGNILGKDMVKENQWIRGQVGYLPSEAVFYSGMKVKDIIKLSADLRKADCKKEAKNLCDRLELDVSRKVEELSFGNRKKVAIVCAFQSNPELLILDEPTGGLDPLMQREFFQIIKEKNKQGATIFLSSHILSEVQKNCDRAAVIRDGSVIVCDSVEALSQTNAKRIHLQGTVNVEGLAGIKDRKEDGDGISFLYSGDLNQLIQALALSKVEDLTITEPDLEEIFLHYYGKDGERA